jgi:quinol monooxygenase YgiN
VNASLCLVVRFSIREGSEQAFDQMLQTLTAATSTEEGCQLFQAHRSTEDPRQILLYECWASREALAAHDTKAHVASFKEGLPAVIAAPVQVSWWVPLPRP